MATKPIRQVTKNITPAGTNFVLLDDGISMGKATLTDTVSAVANGLVDNKIAALDLDTASQKAVEFFATATQGGKADTAVQPGDLATVATTGSQDDMADGTANKNYTATEKTKLGGIEAGADVTDATNVEAAGAVMAASTDASGFGFFLDQDDLTDDDATKAASQQSVKANIDARAPRGKFGTVALMLADADFGYSAARFVVAAGQIIEAGGFRYEVAASGASDQHLTTAGGVKLYVLPPYNIEAFGALISSANRALTDAAFTAAIAALAAAGGGELVIPAGDWYTSANHNIPSNVRLRGSGRGPSVIHGNGDHNGFTLTGNNAAIEGIFIRECQTGIVGANTARWCKVKDCTLSYNRIGIDWLDGYINTVCGNMIAFNTYGAVFRGQCFETNVYDNVIDNNTGGLGVLLIGSPGVNLVGNTIEGNRKTDTYHGVGVIVAGSNIRTNIELNWFEYNGRALLEDGVTVNPYSVNILAGDGVSTVAAALVTNCVPAEYQAAVTATLSITGTLNIRGNFHYRDTTTYIQTRMQFTDAVVNIEGELFEYSPTVNNTLINLIYVSGSGMKHNIGKSIVFNPDGVSKTGAFKGIGGTYVVCNAETPLDMVKVDGVDLYTKVMTLDQFKALPGATMDCTSRLPSSGYASLAYDCKLRGGTKGITTANGTGRLRLGASDVLPTGNPLVAVLLSDPGGKFVYNNSGGGSERTAALTGTLAGLIAVVSLSAPTSALMSLSAGRYYGYCILSAADGATYFGGATRLRISDWYPLEVRNMGTAAPSSAGQNCAVGDIVYNSAPTAGGPEGWICTVAGQPGTWVPFGTVRLEATATYDPPSIAAGALDTTQTMTVTGAALGDLVDVSFSVALAGARLEGWVSGANTVSYRFSNPTGSAIDLGSGTVKARVRK